MSYLNINPANQPQGVSGIPVNVIVQSGTISSVAIAGTPGGSTLVDVNPSIDNDSETVGTDALATQAFGYGYNITNNQWARQTAVPIASGQGFALVVKEAAPPTYIMKTGGLIPASGQHFFAMFLVSGQMKVKIKHVTMANQSLMISGEDMRFTLTRVLIDPTGGSSETAVAHDPTDPASGVALTLRTNPTNLTSSDSLGLRSYVTTTRGAATDEIAVVSGVSTTMIPIHILQTMNLADVGRGTKPWTITSGFGFGLRQEGTNETSGRYIFSVVWTVESE